MHSEKHFRTLIENELSKLNLSGKPARLYDPIRYMISLGGKRLRPSLLMMSHELFAGNPEDVIQPALAIEVFHNFTLLHDDIMDKAPLRRSRETVHKKWNPDIAILSGDTMFVLSCQLMMNVKNEFIRDVLDTFFKTAISVCEGQQLDMDFESIENVSIEDYMNMISLKTASLIGCSTYIGALCSGAGKTDANHMYEFGKNLGIAFQLHDDILDVYGDAEKFGKQVGGDILANKKTYLLLTALQKAGGNIKSELQEWLRSTDFIPEKKIESIISIYEKLDVRRHASEKMEFYFRNALDHLEEVKTPPGSKDALLSLAEQLMIREK
jgi:geranylgeranyl diphosphate synthase, type II